MPMPKPHKGEKQNDFMTRCMAANVMKTDFTDNKQRVAVCIRQWKTKGKRAEDMDKTERRSIPSELSQIQIETRASGLAGIRGYAAVYYDGTPASEFRMGKVVERIMPGTFSRAMKDGADVVCLFNHDERMLLGRRSAKTLRLADDEKGFRYSVDTPNTSYGRDLVDLISRGDVKGSSFSFGVNGPDGENWRSEGELMIRELRDVNLFDVSPVVNPAYTATSLSLRSLKTWAEARNLSGTDFQTLMDQAVVCGFSVDYEMPMDEPVDPNAPVVPATGMYSLVMARRKLNLVELEAGLKTA